MVCIRDVNLGSYLEQLIMGESDGDKTEASDLPPLEHPEWARHLIDKVC